MILRLIIQLSFLWTFSTIYAQVLFHCRTPGESGCLNGGTCDRNTGVCTCVQGFEGYNCGLETSTICPADAASPCGQFGTCYNDNQCYCQYGYIGDTCQIPKVYTDCMGTGLLMEVSVPDSFRGEISIKQNNTEVNNDDILNHVALPDCTFTEEASEVAGFKKLTFTLPLDGSSNCVNASLVEHLNKPDPNDITYETAAVQTFSTLFVTKYDRFLTFLCTHKASNFTMFAKLDTVKLEEKDNLLKKETDRVYSPVRFSVNDMEGLPLTKDLYVGDPFALLFYLMDDSVYKALRIEVCTANDTSGVQPVVFKFMDGGCPTVEGEAIMQNLNGQQLTTHDLNGNTVPAAQLDLLAFKFKSGPNVGFNCKVKICKSGDEAACQPNCGDAAVPGGSSGGSVAGDLSGDVSIGVGGNTGGDPADPAAAADTAATTPAGAGAQETPAPTDAAPTDAPPARRRRRRSSGGEELKESFSAIVRVIDPTLQPRRELIIETPKQTSGPKEKTSTDCFRSQEILIVIVVMSALVFILLVACLVLSITIIRARNKFVKRDDSSGSSSPRFFIPRANFQA